MNPVRLACAVLVAAWIAPAAVAQSYKCLDRAGKAFYSDRPCAERGMTEQKVLKDAPRPGEPPPHARSTKPTGDEAQKAAPVKRDARGNEAS